VAGVHGADLADVQVVQGHEQLGTQRAVVHVARAQEECAQELQHHVVQLDILTDHLGQLQDHLGGGWGRGERYLSRVVLSGGRADASLELQACNLSGGRG